MYITEITHCAPTVIYVYITEVTHQPPTAFCVQITKECIPVGCVLPARCCTGSLRDSPPPGQRPALDRDPPWTETPSHRDPPGQRPPPWTETPLDRHPPPTGQTPPHRTDTPLDRDPSGQRGRDRDRPVDRQSPVKTLPSQTSFAGSKN